MTKTLKTECKTHDRENPDQYECVLSPWVCSLCGARKCHNCLTVKPENEFYTKDFCSKECYLQEMFGY